MPYVAEHVFEGARSHLFLSGGSNDVLHLFSLGQKEREDLGFGWLSLLRNRGSALAASGIIYKHCFIPDKLSIHREEAEDLWTGLASPSETVEKLTSNLPCPYLVPLTAYMRRQKSKYEMYFKTDTHWTVEGCFSAYQMICASLSLNQRADLISAPRGTVELFGDLGAKLTPPRKELFCFGSFGRSARRVYANDLVLIREKGVVANQVGLHVGSMVRFVNDSAQSPLKILIFGDSFSEYRTHFLTGLMADTVAEVTFAWSSSIDYRLVDDLRPNVVITELAERFMRQLPSDTIDIASHAERKVAQALKSAFGAPAM